MKAVVERRLQHWWNMQGPAARAATWRSLRSGRAAGIAFVALEVVALPLMLSWGRGRWFGGDDWDFLALRTSGNLGDLFRAHLDHWTTLPILAYRVLWSLVGIRSYRPYQFLAISLHLISAALLRIVMRRATVGAWLATIFAAAFLFFGSGAFDIEVAFQITFGGSLVFGLTHLLLADHDGPVDRRDWLGLLAGFAGLLCSAVAVPMTIIVGVATVLRRGWRISVLHTAPLACAYVIWLATIGRSGEHFPRTHPSVGEIARFVGIGLRSTLGDLGILPGVGLALAALLIVGLTIAFVGNDRDSLRRGAAAPIALLVGAFVFLLVTAIGRAGLPPRSAGGGRFAAVLGPAIAGQGRYVYLAAAMMLPAVALAAQSISRRWRVVGAASVVLLMLGIPGNIERFADFKRLFVSQDTPQKIALLAPRVPNARELPRLLVPDPLSAPDLTLGWLIDGVRSGRVPAPGSITPTQLASVALRLDLSPLLGREGVALEVPRSAHCRALLQPTLLVLAKGGRIGFKRGVVRVTDVPLGGVPSRPVTVRPSIRVGGETLVAWTGPLRVRIAPVPFPESRSTVVFCDATGVRHRDTHRP